MRVWRLRWQWIWNYHSHPPFASWWLLQSPRYTQQDNHEHNCVVILKKSVLWFTYPSVFDASPHLRSSPVLIIVNHSSWHAKASEKIKSSSFDSSKVAHMPCSFLIASDLVNQIYRKAFVRWSSPHTEYNRVCSFAFCLYALVRSPSIAGPVPSRPMYRAAA